MQPVPPTLRPRRPPPNPRLAPPLSQTLALYPRADWPGLQLRAAHRRAGEAEFAPGMGTPAPSGPGLAAHARWEPAWALREVCAPVGWRALPASGEARRHEARSREGRWGRGAGARVVVAGGVWASRSTPVAAEAKEPIAAWSPEREGSAAAAARPVPGEDGSQGAGRVAGPTMRPRSQPSLPRVSPGLLILGVRGGGVTRLCVSALRPPPCPSPETRPLSPGSFSPTHLGRD